MAATVIIPTMYGIELKPHDDPYIELAEAANDSLNKASVGAYLVVRPPMSQCGHHLNVAEGRVPHSPVCPQLAPRC